MITKKKTRNEKIYKNKTSTENTFDTEVSKGSKQNQMRIALRTKKVENVKK